MRVTADHAVVITGASSGIGRATAHAFARTGARLVLCARGQEALNEVVRECRELGAPAITIPTDMRDADAVQRLARMAAETFGGIAVWVNNAGGGAVGRFWEVPLEAHRATVELDLLGYMHGAYAALPYFLNQGRGVLINTNSVGGFVPTPYAAAYAAGKAGARAFANSLALELRPWPHIQVCSVFPTFVNTPGVQHAANYSGRAVRPTAFATPPETVAATIVELARRPRREVMVDLAGRAARLQYRIAPRLVERVTERVMATYFARAEPAPSSDGNLHASSSGPTTVHGGWHQAPRLQGLPLALGVAAAAGLLAIEAYRRRQAS